MPSEKNDPCKLLVNIPYVWQDIRRELGIDDIIEEQKMQLPKVNKTCDKCGHGEATYYTKQVLLHNTS